MSGTVTTVQAYYEGLGIRLGLEDIIATTGGSEALLFAFLACANEGLQVSGLHRVGLWRSSLEPATEHNGSS